MERSSFYSSSLKSALRWADEARSRKMPKTNCGGAQAKQAGGSRYIKLPWLGLKAWLKPIWEAGEPQSTTIHVWGAGSIGWGSSQDRSLFSCKCREQDIKLTELEDINDWTIIGSDPRSWAGPAAASSSFMSSLQTSSLPALTGSTLTTAELWLNSNKQNVTRNTSFRTELNVTGCVSSSNNGSGVRAAGPSETRDIRLDEHTHVSVGLCWVKLCPRRPKGQDSVSSGRIITPSGPRARSDPLLFHWSQFDLFETCETLSVCTWGDELNIISYQTYSNF